MSLKAIDQYLCRQFPSQVNHINFPVHLVILKNCIHLGKVATSVSVLLTIFKNVYMAGLDNNKFWNYYELYYGYKWHASPSLSPVIIY